MVKPLQNMILQVIRPLRFSISHQQIVYQILYNQGDFENLQLIDLMCVKSKPDKKIQCLAIFI